MQATIRLKRRYPTRELAEWEAQFLPNCGWRAVEIGEWFYLEFNAEPHRAQRIAGYVREHLRTIPVEVVVENV
jgi:hypothetical protein